MIFLIAELRPKRCFSTQEIHPLLVNGVITASSHANKDKSINCDIYVTCVDVRGF